MLACGSSSGQVSVFQIQKEHPPDLNLVTPLTKPKPVERFEHFCIEYFAERLQSGISFLPTDIRYVIFIRMQSGQWNGQRME